jgi:peptidoglycan/xylan/chitin deacetylase (PgdA/CDA1 family)
VFGAYTLYKCFDIRLNEFIFILFSTDDGPHSEYTKIVLDQLKEANIKATFFLTGVNNFETNETRYRETVQRMYNEVKAFIYENKFCYDLVINVDWKMGKLHASVKLKPISHISR